MAKSDKEISVECERIEHFLKDTFNRYLLRYDMFFHGQPSYGKYEETPLFENGHIRKDILSRAAMLLGLSEKDILSCNATAAKSWYRKYPFFELLNQFYTCRSISAGELDDFRCENAERYISSVCEGYTFERCKTYDRDSVRERMIAMLKRANEFLPGTYHEGAKILEFDFATENFFSFPKIGALIGAFADILTRLKELFFKAWKHELEDAQIKEYNFLVTMTRMADNLTEQYIYYDDLKKLIPVYMSEGFKGERKEFFDIAHLRFCNDFEPWECREFVEDDALIQLYASCFPYAKRKMFDYGISSKYFFCAFVWSDADIRDIQIVDDDDFEEDPDDREYFNKLENQFNKESEAFKDTGVQNIAWITTVRVPKTPEELDREGYYIEKLIRRGGVASKGGIKMPKLRRIDENERPERTEARLIALKGGAL